MRLSPRLRRAPAILAALSCAAVLMAGCQSQEADYHAVEADLARTATVPRQFVWVRQTLTGTQTVSGQYQDPYRYDVLYSQGGQAAWEEIVHDDAVADRLLDPSAALTFLSSRGSAGTAPGVTAGPSGAAGLSSAATVSGGSVTGSNATADALLARHWVEDPTGAPGIPSVGNEVQAEKADPFYASLIFLQDVEALITAAPNPQVRRWRPNDVQPAYKPTDDPFPKPPAGVTRYDVLQQPLPVLTSNSPGGTPAPPTLSNLVKIAVYVRHGLVVQIRMVVDPVDQLQALVDNYHLSLPKGLTRSGQEAFAQRVLDKLSSGATGPAIKIGQTVWSASELGQSQPVNLPPGAVMGNLSILPGRGSRTGPAGT